MLTAEAFVIDMPVLVKARTGSERRIVEVQASAEVVDSEGDLILQSALLGGAEGFLKSGHIDIDHLSEVGGRFGLTNLEEWIVGKPLEVKDIGGGNTSVVCELNVSMKADKVWETLTREKPVEWRSSIYGFPTADSDSFMDVRAQKSADSKGATRYIVKSMQWKSLALTQRPICDAITGSAKIVFGKAMLSDIGRDGIFDIDGTVIKSAASSEVLEVVKAPVNFQYPNEMPIETLYPPRSMSEIEGQYLAHIEKGKCAFAGNGNGRSVFSFRNHFMACCGLDYDSADIFAHALARRLKAH